MTADSFAEIAMDFCSRNSFDRPPQAPRPPGGSSTAPPPAKRMHEMSEDEQLQAAMQASMSDAPGGGGDAVGDDDEIVYVDDDSESDEAPGGGALDAKPQAVPTPSLLAALLDFTLPPEPNQGSRIQLRLPDGKRIVRSFLGLDPVRAIYAFVAVRPCGGHSIQHESAQTDYSHTFFVVHICSKATTKFGIQDGNLSSWPVIHPVIY